MIRRLTKNELIDLLTKRDQNKYIYELNLLHNTGNPNLAVTDMWGYSMDDDVAVVSVYWFDGCGVYFEISDFSHLQPLFNEIESTVKEHKELLLQSDSKELFQNPEFIKRFGKHDVQMQEQYGMFHPEKAGECDEHIRKLTVDDEAMIATFQEPHIPYRQNLRNAYETQIKTHDKNCAVYGYIDHQTGILGYLIANTFDGQYWDISYIYVAKTARRRGIAKKLACFYAIDMSAKDFFASYGTPENEISKQVAISSGFERFSRTYLTQWIPTE